MIKMDSKAQLTVDIIAKVAGNQGQGGVARSSTCWVLLTACQGGLSSGRDSRQCDTCGQWPNPARIQSVA